MSRPSSSFMPMTTGLTAAVLAAGSSQRLGRSKLLLDVGGKPVVWRVVAAAAEAKPAEVLVVVSPDSREEVRAALDELPVRLVVNERSAEGMGASIAAAARAVGADSAGLILLQGDQPLVTGAMLLELIAACEGGGHAFAASSYAGIETTPVVFDRRLLAELSALGGDRGARAVLARHRAEGITVAFPPDLGSDLDTEADYRRIVEISGRRPA